MDGLELVRDTEGDVHSNSEQFDQEEHQLQQQEWRKADEDLTNTVLKDKPNEQEAHWEVPQAQGSEDQVDEVRLHTTEEFQKSDQTEEGEKRVDQTDEKQVEQREDIGKLVHQEEAEKQVDQNGEVEQQVNEKEEVDEQVEEYKEVENQTDQEEEVERNVLQEDEVEKVERVGKEQQLLKDENQTEQEVNEHLHDTEHLNPDQESEKREQREFQEDLSLKEKEADFKEEYKELVTQEQEVEEPANDKVHLIKQEEQTNHKKKDTKNSDQKITGVDWIDRTSKGVPLYRRKSISESRQKWEVLEKQQHQPKLDNNRNHRERGEKIKFIEKELHTAGIIMAEAKTSRFGGTNEKCAQCNRTVYAMEKMEVIGRVMHKTCFRCSKCNSPLSVGRFSVGGGNLYCLTHYKQAFREKGTYDVFTPDNPCKGKWQQNADTPEAPKAQE